MTGQEAKADVVQAVDGGDDDADAEATRLDRLWAVALTLEAEAGDPDDADGDEEDAALDAATARFVDGLLAEPLVCPVADDPDTVGTSDTIRPLLVSRAGGPTLLAFDTEERLAEFVEEPTAFVVCPGRTLFRLAREAEAQLGLNLDVAPSASLFGAPAVAAIAELADATEEVVDVGRGAAMAVAPPAAPDPAFLRAATARLAADGRVDEAWLVALSADDGGAGAFDRAIALAPKGGAANSAEFGDLAADLGRLAAALDPAEGPLDVAVLPAEAPLLQAARRLGVGLGLS